MAIITTATILIVLSSFFSRKAISRLMDCQVAVRHLCKLFGVRRTPVLVPTIRKGADGTAWCQKIGGKFGLPVFFRIPVISVDLRQSGARLVDSLAHETWHHQQFQALLEANSGYLMLDEEPRIGLLEELGGELRLNVYTDVQRVVRKHYPRERWGAEVEAWYVGRMIAQSALGKKMAENLK